MDSRPKIHIEAKFLPSQKIRCFSAYSSSGKTAFENCLAKVERYSKLSNERYELNYIFKIREPLPTKSKQEERMLEKADQIKNTISFVCEKFFYVIVFLSMLFGKLFEQTLIALEILFIAAIAFPFLYLAFGSASNVHHVDFFKNQLGIFISCKFFKYYLYIILFFILTRFVRKLTLS